MAELELAVNGFVYAGWKSVRITRSIESLAGSFALDVSDRWGEEMWAILEEDACEVRIDGTPVISGYVDKRSISAAAGARTLSYSGRDRAAALVDSSVQLSRWTFRNVNVADFAAAIAKPFGVPVSVQPGLVLPKVPKLVISPGDTAYEAIKRAAGDDGVMIASDGRGGIVLTRAGGARAAALIEGQNILSAGVEYDGADRYHRYVIATQAAGTDDAAGNATRVQAEAIDEGVRRADRVLLIRPDKGYNVETARRRADWEARIRAARAETVTVAVQGWKQPSGMLWDVNLTTRVAASRLLGVEGDMLISQVEFSLGDQGKVSQLKLVRPDAFAPEPKAIVKSPAKGGGSGWKELKKGGL